jgi:hypothetical protein
MNQYLLKIKLNKQKNNKGATFDTLVTTRCGAQKTTNPKFFDRNIAARSARFKAKG